MYVWGFIISDSIQLCSLTCGMLVNKDISPSSISTSSNRLVYPEYCTFILLRQKSEGSFDFPLEHEWVKRSLLDHDEAVGMLC